MKNYIYLVVTFLFIFTSCDVEEGPYITDYDAYINPEKKVLIEDFTGHTCSFCPGAAREIEAIHDIYGDQIIALAIHVSDQFARPYPIAAAPKFQYDFRTSWGDNWDETYSMSLLGLPRGMVNRVATIANQPQLNKDEWAGRVALELKKEINFLISISSDNSEISIDIEVTNNIENTHNIVVCLAENNIVNWQKDGQTEVENYVHNHVLRSVIADISISNNQNFNSGEIITKTFTYDINDLEQENIDYSNSMNNGNGNAGGWNANNISVIAYIYNTVTEEIVQVEEAKLNE